MSRSLVGSSISSRSAGCSISRAISTRACSPPERLADRPVELAGIEEEPLRPSRDVDRPVAIDHRVAVRAEPFAQRHARDRAVRAPGRSRRCAAPARVSTVPASGAISPFRMRSSVVLPVPFSPSSPSRVPGVRVKLRSRNSVRPPIAFDDALHRDQPLGAPVGGGEIDLRRRSSALR